MRIEDIVTGETYRIRQWEDMANEFGVSSDGSYIPIPGPAFIKDMLYLCGSDFKVVRKGKFGGRVGLEGITSWGISCHMLEPIEPDDDMSEISISLEMFLGDVLKA